MRSRRETSHERLNLDEGLPDGREGLWTAL
jgi:hypothetical protein